ncbi:MAG: hypothetical protein LBM67_07385 [Lentimicrobiaceae bacterium]|jgi:hypothetical protein|nr:hypothetical protein [Lentimicrobiaceae bacterium]
MKRILPLVGFLLFVFSMQVEAQKNIKNEKIETLFFQATYSFQMPGGDLKNYYGNNSTIGGGVNFKTKQNWMFGLHGHFIFGNDVKIRREILRMIGTPDGEIIDGNGTFTSLSMQERGYHFQAKAGKLFPIFSPNPNSGFFVMAGVGYLLHRIRIETQFGTAPQLEGDYAKGYDRMRGGFAYSGEFGYLYLSNSRLANFSISLEFTQAFTKGLRDYDFSMMGKDNKSYVDNYFGIKISWIIPTYVRVPKEYYYY